MTKTQWRAIPLRAGQHRHHAIRESRVRQAGGDPFDPRNCVVLDIDEHFSHHGAMHKLPLSRLPNAVFHFAAEVLGPGPAYGELRRRYSGEDPRLEALLED